MKKAPLVALLMLIALGIHAQTNSILITKSYQEKMDEFEFGNDTTNFLRGKKIVDVKAGFMPKTNTVDLSTAIACADMLISAILTNQKDTVYLSRKKANVIILNDGNNIGIMYHPKEKAWYVSYVYANYNDYDIRQIYLEKLPLEAKKNTKSENNLLFSLFNYLFCFILPLLYFLMIA